MDHTGQENIWFVGCLTTARATPASREGADDNRRVSNSVFNVTQIIYIVDK